jgi:hypothetical protein
MLGEQIKDLKGKIIGQRVLDAEGPTMEISISAKGSANGIQINESLSFVYRPSSQGVLHGEGQGVLMSGESEMATFTVEGNRKNHPFRRKVAWSGFLEGGINWQISVSEQRRWDL